jgi:hypothetical protein
MAVPVVGATWLARIFRDTTTELRKFKISRAGNMSIAVYDMQSDNPEKEIYFSKADIQFLDYVEGPENEENVETFKQETQGDRKPDPNIIRSGDSRNDGGVRTERHGQDGVRRELPKTTPPARHPGKGR